MMQPVHALASTELSMVTNGRGTSDNSHGGAADLYALGTSGLLMGARNYLTRVYHTIRGVRHTRGAGCFLYIFLVSSSHLHARPLVRTCRCVNETDLAAAHALSTGSCQAMGLWSSRDNVFTTAVEPGCVGDSNKSNCTSPDYRLQNVAAVLSGGPYGPSDGIGFLNAALIGRSCRSDGVLLKSDAPLAVTDFAYATTFDNPREAVHVWATHSDIMAGSAPASPSVASSAALRWLYILSINTPSSLEMSLSELGATPGLDYAVVDFWGTNGSVPSASSVQRVHVSAKAGGGKFTIPMSPPQAPVKGGSDAGTYQVLAPVLRSGWCLLGEAKKIVAASGRRFVAVEDFGPSPSGRSLEITLLLADNEPLELWLLAPAPADTPHGNSRVPTFNLVQATCPPRPCTGVDCDVRVKVVCGHDAAARNDCRCAPL